LSSGRHVAKLLIVVLGLLANGVRAESILVGVASNFAVAAREIAERFEAEVGHDVRISTASTGHLFVQIENGAPFDILLAADVKRPLLLESSGRGVQGSRFTYAIGRLVLWSRDPELRGQDCLERLGNLGTSRLAIANPDIAPYGNAARQALTQLKLWERVQPRLVVGENITQTLQFTASGNARFGLVAMSQTDNEHLPDASCSWNVPPELHQPIEQQAIMLERASNNLAAREFLAFLIGDPGQGIIARHGYLLPGQGQ
jgi:molybdate transport system substrate-binding protein